MMKKNLDKSDDFSMLVVELLKKEKLIESCFDFIELAQAHEINIDSHIFFHGEYQKLLLESIILNISYLLIDKIKTKAYKSRMQIKLDEVAKLLKQDIEQDKPSFNFTAVQKGEILKELIKIRQCKEYHKAIKSIHTTRNQIVAHRGEKDFSQNVATLKQIKLICKNVKRSDEIYKLVLYNVRASRVSYGAIEHDHRNIVQALLIQEDIKLLKDRYHKSEWRIGDRWFSDEVDFWKEKLMPLLEVSAVEEEINKDEMM